MRYFTLAQATLVVCLFALPLVGADEPPNFTGTWELDASKSPGSAGRAITLTIAEKSGKITFNRVSRDKDGKEIVSQFTCQAGGATCDFDEGGHKAKVSLWYNGSALVILKTDGPKEDAVTQWKLELSPDKSTLNVDFSHIDPTDKEETLIFDKKSS